MPDAPASASATQADIVNAIRALAMDAVQKANSGHPGMPMGMAEIAEVLWRNYLRHNPANPAWPDRDRFVLSNGHGSMLQYALLHLTGYDLPMDEIRKFRQLHSKTPGHPEVGCTPGVETTTGPLGQGLANGVGMALAERLLAATFNRQDHTIVDHHTYVFVGDGCLMEGISHEACSLAGTLGLGKLIVLYDDNGISIDGPTSGWFTDDTPKRFEAYGWHVVPNVDGHDVEAVDAPNANARRWCAARRRSARVRRPRRARRTRTGPRSANAKSPRRARRSTGRIPHSRFRNRSTTRGMPVRAVPPTNTRGRTGSRVTPSSSPILPRNSRVAMRARCRQRLRQLPTPSSRRRRRGEKASRRARHRNRRSRLTPAYCPRWSAARRT